MSRRGQLDVTFEGHFIDAIESIGPTGLVNYVMLDGHAFDATFDPRLLSD